MTTQPIAFGFFLAAFASRIFALFANHLVALKQRHHHDHSRTALLNKVRQWLFDLWSKSFDFSGVQQRLAGLNHTLRQLPHRYNQVGSSVYRRLPTDGSHLNGAAFAGDDAQTVAAEQRTAIAGSCVRNFLFIQRTLNTQDVLFEVCPELTLQVGRHFGVVPLAFDVARCVAAHLFQKLHVSGARFFGDVGALEQLHDADTFFFLVQRGQHHHVFGRKLDALAMNQGLGFTGLQNVDQQLLVLLQSAGDFAQTGLVEVRFGCQSQSAAFVQPDGSTFGTDRRDNAVEKFGVEDVRRNILAGHLFDFPCQLHHLFANATQILFV